MKTRKHLMRGTNMFGILITTGGSIKRVIISRGGLVVKAAPPLIARFLTAFRRLCGRPFMCAVAWKLCGGDDVAGSPITALETSDSSLL